MLEACARISRCVDVCIVCFWHICVICYACMPAMYVCVCIVYTCVCIIYRFISAMKLIWHVYIYIAYRPWCQPACLVPHRQGRSRHPTGHSYAPVGTRKFQEWRSDAVEWANYSGNSKNGALRIISLCISSCMYIHNVYIFFSTYVLNIYI